MKGSFHRAGPEIVLWISSSSFCFPQRAFGIFRAQLDVFVRHLKTLDWKLDRFYIKRDGSTLDHPVLCYSNITRVASRLQVEIQPDDGDPLLAGARVRNRFVLPSDFCLLYSGFIGNRQANGLALLSRDCRNEKGNDVNHTHCIFTGWNS